MNESDWQTIPTTESDWVSVQEPKKTVFMEDRGQVVEFPDNYDELDMKYSVAVDVDKKDKNDFFGMVQTSAKLAENLGKGIARWVGMTPQFAGNLMIEAGETKNSKSSIPDDLGDFLVAPWEISQMFPRMAYKALGVPDRLIDAGQNLIDTNKRFLDETNLKPTAESGAPKVAFDLGMAGASVLGSIGLAYLSKKPQLVAPIFGAIQKSMLYEEHREAGIDPDTASGLSTVGGVVEWALELKGLHVFLDAVKVSDVFPRIAVRSLTQATQEGSQQLAEEVLTAFSGVRQDTIQDISKRVGYATALGLFSAAPVAAMVTMAERQGVIKDLKEIGFTDAQARSTVKKISTLQLNEGLADAVAQVLEKEASPLSMTAEERKQAFTNLQTELSGLSLSPDALDTEFKPTEESKRPTFDEQIENVVGEKVSRETVIEGLQDEKVKLKLQELDDQATQLDEVLKFLEKDQKKLEKSGKSPFALVAVEKNIKEFQRQYDVVDSERADILTSAIKNLEKEDIKIKGAKLTDLTLKQKVKSFKEGAKVGRKITQQETEEVRKALFDLAEQSELTTGEAEKLLTKSFIEGIKTPKQLASKLTDISERIDEIVDTRKAKEIKGKIQDLLAGTKVKSENGRPVGKFTPEIQQIMDRAREISKMTQKAAREKIAVNMELAGEELPSDEIRLENRLLNMMAGFDTKNPTELAKVLDELEAIAGAGKAESLLKQMDRRERQATNKEKLLKVVIGGEVLDETTRKTVLKELNKSFNTLGSSLWSNWDDLLEQLSVNDKTSGKGQSELVKVFSVAKIAIAERIAVTKLSQQIVESAKKVYGLKNEYEVAQKMFKDYGDTDLGVFKFSDGVSRRLIMSKAQMRKRWMEMQDPTLWKAIRAPEGNAYTTQIVEAVERQLSEQDKAFAREQLRFYRDYYKSVNEVFRRQYGVDLPFNENYSPIRKKGVEKVSNNPLKDESDLYASFIPQSFIGRVSNLRPLRDMNDWEVMQRHIIQMEHFAHWADMIRDMDSFFNDGKVQETIEAQFGPKINRVIEDKIREFKNRGARQVSSYDKWFEAMRTGKVIFELGGGPLFGFDQYPKQLTGFLSYAEFVSPKEFVTGLGDFLKNHKTAIETLKQSGLIQIYQGDITQEYLGLLSSQEAQSFLASPTIKAGIRFWMMMARHGNVGAMMFGGWPVYKATLDRTGDPKAAMDAFEEAALKVQPSSLLGQMSEWQKGSNFQRLFSVFTSSTHKYFMMELHAIRNGIAGREPVEKVAKTLLIFHVLLPTLFQLVANGFKWDREDQIRAALTGSVNGALILGDFADGAIRVFLNEAAGFDLDRFKEGSLIADPVDGIFKAIEDLDLGEVDMESVFEAVKTLAVQTVGPITGLPTKMIFDVFPNAKDDILENEEHVKGALKFLGWSPYQIDKVYDKE